jgi:osmotically-inducible protein OsmY
MEKDMKHRNVEDLMLRPRLRRDEEIRAEVHALLADQFGYIPECWTVGVHDGVVTLRGELPTRGDALAIRAAITRIGGVVAVEGEPTYAVEGAWDD